MTLPTSDPASGRLALFDFHFAPIMLTSNYTPEGGWSPSEVRAREPLSLDPATMVLHYGQAVFEGVKAYRQPDGSWALFRPYDYAKRLLGGCDRLAIPQLPVERCVTMWQDYVIAAASSLPAGDDVSLYLRTLLLGTDVMFGARPSTTFLAVVLGVVLPTDTSEQRGRMSVLITTDYVRAAPGGVGMAKAPGNYAAGMGALRAAREQGCDQVLWLDAGRRRWVEELGSMNVMFVMDGGVVTPSLTDTMLAGVTRSTVKSLCDELRIPFEERPVALEEITAAMSWQGCTEAFGTSTASGLRSIGTFLSDGRTLELPEETPVADRLRERLDAYRRGREPDHYHWLVAVEPERP